jgi:SpoVK/Ycf46/Vps4 family AAA+-type ATPase
MHDGHERFADLGGLAALKAFCLRALRPRPHDSPVQPKGVLLLSPPGCGKSAIAKALGNEVNRPTLRLDLGALMGSLVGQTEANTRRAIAIIEAMAPCLVFIDEIDKGLSGVGSQAGDSGVSARMFGTLLTWLSDRTSQVMVIATANSIDRLPPEFLRAERFDGVFFLDLPTSEERTAIWKIHRQVFGIAESESQPPDEGWTGAEIRACCRLAALLDVPLTTAAQQIVPVSISAAEQLANLREWASGRCLSAHEAGIYQASLTAKKRRNVRLDPSAN